MKDNVSSRDGVNPPAPGHGTEERGWNRIRGDRKVLRRVTERGGKRVGLCPRRNGPRHATGIQQARLIDAILTLFATNFNPPPNNGSSLK